MQVAHDPDDPFLYIAVRVVDDSAVLGTAEIIEWESRDGLEVYVGVAQTEGRLRLAQESLYGDSRFTSFTYGGQGDDVPSVGRIVRNRTADGFTYEVKIDLSRLANGLFQWEPYSSIPFDIVVDDMDEDGSFSWVAWGAYSPKLSGESRLGDVLRVDRPIDVTTALEQTNALQTHSATRAGERMRKATMIQALAAGALGTVAMIHLILQGSGIQRRANLFYAIATASAAVLVYVALLNVSASASWLTNDLGQLLTTSSLLIAAHFSLQFLYTIFTRRVPGWYWLMVLASIVLIGLQMKDLAFAARWLEEWGGALTAITIVSMAAEALRIVGTAIWRRQEGSRTIGLGVAGFIVSSLYLTAGPLMDPTLPLVILFLSPIAAVSVHLSRHVASTSLQLDARNLALSRANQQIE